MASKPPITCHVLDTTIGKPAANIPVTLILHSPSKSDNVQLTYSATTNADGRVTAWKPRYAVNKPEPLEEAFHSEPVVDRAYSLVFDTEEYFGERGIQTFFPEVEVKFVVRGVKRNEHYHVPVLLGPFGYTTYRGS